MKILNAIVSVLDCYFKAKSESFSKKKILQLDESADVMYTHLIILYHLKQHLLNETKKSFH